MQPVSDPVVPQFVERLQRIDTYAEIEEIMKSPDFVMAGAEERTVFLEDCLIMAEGQRHSELKQLFAPLFSRQAVAYYELHLVEPVIREVIAEMQNLRGPDGFVRIDVVPLIQATLTRISAEVTGVDGETVLSCAAGDADALAATIRRGLDDKQLRDKIGLAGRARVAERWSWRHCAQLTVDQYREVLSMPDNLRKLAKRQSA